MAGSPEWKVYDAAGTYQAACKEGEAAACLVALYGAGATIRYGHGKAVWVEGSEEFSAADSYDRCALLADERRRRNAAAAYDRIHGAGAAAALLSRKF